MKTTKTIISLLLVFVFCVSTISFSLVKEAKAYGETFIIDPGHGGEDPGACGSNPYREEADDVLELSLLVGEIVSQYTSVMFTRTTDATLSLRQRSSMANANDNSYLISIHRNSATATARGLEVFYYNGLSSDSASAQFARDVYNGVMELVPWVERGVKSENFHMVREPYMPSCLIEAGFISNNDDNEMFDQYFNEIAFGIAKGMLAQIGITPSGFTGGNKFEGASPIFIGNDFAAYIRHTATGKYITDVDNALYARDGAFDATQAFHFFYNSDDGTYSMYSDAKNKWFDVAGSVYDDGTTVGLWDGNGQENQRFYMYYINGNFYFRPKAQCKSFDVAADSGILALWGDNAGDNDVSRAARAFEVLKINMDYSSWYLNLGADDVVYIRNVASGLLMTGNANQDVWFSGPDYTDSQKWQLLRRADGSYEFKHVQTGKYLDVEGSFIDAGTRVNLWDCNGQKGQGFYIIQGDENAYVIKPCYTEHVLDMAADTGDVGIYPPHLDWDVPRAAQLFEIVFEKLDGNTIPAENIGTDFEATLTTKKNGRALTDLGNGVLEARECTNANNQIFKFYYDASSNSYEIVGNSGKALDVTGTGYANGTGVGLYDRNNWVAQRFRLHKIGEHYALSPIFTNRVVDVDNGNDTNVLLWGTDVTDNRLFKITRVSSSQPTPTPSEDTLTLKNTSKYSKDGAMLYKVAAGQTASGLMSNFDNSSIEVWDANGTKVANNAKVGTGYTVNLIVDGTKYDSVTVIISGDVTGDGVVDTTDYMRVKAHFLNTYKLTSCYKTAADVDGSNTIDTTDYFRVKSHFLGSYNLYA